VDDHFAQVQFENKPKMIAKYAKWAMRKDGPMVWQTPTPVKCIFESSNPDYIVHSSLQAPKLGNDLEWI
jgi:hypothetical protein